MVFCTSQDGGVGNGKGRNSEYYNFQENSGLLGIGCFLCLHVKRLSVSFVESYNLCHHEVSMIVGSNMAIGCQCIPKNSRSRPLMWARNKFTMILHDKMYLCGAHLDTAAVHYFSLSLYNVAVYVRVVGNDRPFSQVLRALVYNMTDVLTAMGFPTFSLLKSGMRTIPSAFSTAEKTSRAISSLLKR